jgi:hypothetical protein
MSPSFTDTRDLATLRRCTAVAGRFKPGVDVHSGCASWCPETAAAMAASISGLGAASRKGSRRGDDFISGENLVDPAGVRTEEKGPVAAGT